MRHLEQLAKLRDISLEHLSPFDTMPIVIDYSTDRFYLLAKKEVIKKLLLLGELTVQKIANVVEVPLELVQEIEATLKK